MQEEKFFKLVVFQIGFRVGSFMIWLKPKLAVRMSIFDPSIFVLLLAYHEFNFALKSTRITIIYGFFSAI